MSRGAQPHPVVLDGDEIEDVKDRWREAVRETRRQRSPRARQEAARALAAVVRGIPAVADARCVACYAARPGEPDTVPLLEALAARGVRVLLPVLGTNLRRDWAEYQGAEDLRERAPGRPPEPSGPSLGPAALADADVVLAPALAVDSRGSRLGQGGGWYDRVLADARPGVPVIALVHDEEVYDATVHPVPVQPHDRGVDAVATPSGWRPLGQEGATVDGEVDGNGDGEGEGTGGR
ncbi:5-formyltetrahydrofolate cyclo-ligase [Cellulomonas marina]|uniref:5-formyltetrahydrofolate cyclo-ligase n=1 Tax=Cellulomonas marina TaxID=988821 RepID=A0A1I0X591_9CELL|nr:5-formyltetrahydrofolate cyclo-ligase [Cellulomonas marina]GIG28963.1 5-formyltetrahydrofolate cyclo-ligase [Cellulomonas marina]SFA96222.1 5-formyltetrahydrofolate cyclo-ligase [Cellulomonas marina]